MWESIEIYSGAVVLAVALIYYIWKKTRMSKLEKIITTIFAIGMTIAIAGAVKN
jgi:hypothetical protein